MVSVMEGREGASGVVGGVSGGIAVCLIKNESLRSCAMLEGGLLVSWPVALGELHWSA